MLRDATEDYYGRVRRFVLDALGAKGPPLVVGISGPQGGGKSTLADHLVQALTCAGQRAVTVSIDDFYLPHAEQLALAEAHPGNPYLEHRGYPGTHDVALGERTLDALVGGGAALLPAYDKSAHGGRGDRADAAFWRSVRGPFDVIVLEGWMLGFSPVAEASLGDPRMVEPNRLLARYAAWNTRLDALVLLEAFDLHDVVRWRVESERRRREQGAVGLSDDEARDYIERFLPAYRVYVPQLREAHLVSPWLHMVLGADRLPRC